MLFSCLKRKKEEVRDEVKKEDTVGEKEVGEKETCWENTVEFTFPTKGGKVIKVYDGDTITIASKLPYENSPVYRLHVRLHGIDCPEIKSKGDEKTVALMAREFVSNMVLHKYVRLENIQSDKYGRLLADVYIDDIHLNELLVTKKYAVRYDGGTKHCPDSWLTYNKS